MSTMPFRVGTAKSEINPGPGVGPVYRAGYKMGEAEQLVEIVDDIFLRCLTIENGVTKLVFLSLDLIGLFRDFTQALAEKVSPQGVTADSLLVATTHMHSGPDTMGVWGPSFEQSGYNEKYIRFLIDESAKAIVDALNTSQPARAFFAFEEKDLGVANYREPGEVNHALWSILFRTGDEHIGSLLSYPAQPELAPRDDDRISGDYPGEACRVLDEKLGGVNLFLLGSCGGMEPEGCEKGYDVGHAYGRKVAEEVINLAKRARPLSGDRLSIKTREVELPVENPGFQMMMESGMIHTTQRPPNALTTVSRAEIADLTIYAIPGESFPGIVDEIKKAHTALFINQVNDSLGYFIPPYQWREEPVEWAEGHHFTGHELESLGKQAGENIRQGLLMLAGQ